MKLGDATRKYVANKQATGMVFEAEAYILRALTEKLGPNVPIKKITSDSVLDYLNGHGPVTLFWHRKHDALSGFWKFAIQHGYTDRCPVPARRPQKPTPFIPYIYTREELRRLLDGVTYQKRWCKLEPITHRALLLLMYSAGLRTSEPIRLACSDVDLADSTLTIRVTKFYKTRRIALITQLRGVLAEYDANRHLAGHSRDDTAPFFTYKHGGPVARMVLEEIDAGFNAETPQSVDSWRQRVLPFLAQSFEPQVFIDFQKLWMQNADNGWENKHIALLGMLEGLLAKTVDQDSPLELVRSGLFSGTRTQPTLSPVQSKKVFIVHGYDEGAKESVARFLERLKLEPIILHEQPNAGRTVIEKFEAYADVGFAVVLLTPDDVGASASVAIKPEGLQPRARQNVVFELGYFIGRLSRRRVCALYKKGVEIPSDYEGVVYVELDPAGPWRVQLAQELSEAGVPISLEALLKKN
jgi:integrase